MSQANPEMMDALNALAIDKGISVDVLFGALADALESAYKRMPEAHEYAWVTIDPDTFEVSYEHATKPIPVATARITNPFRAERDDRPDLPPLNTTIVVEDAGLASRLLRFYQEHYTRFLTDEDRADEAYVARVMDEASDDATEMTEAVMEISGRFDADDGFNLARGTSLLNEPLFGVSPLMMGGLEDLLGISSLGSPRVSVYRLRLA